MARSAMPERGMGNNDNVNSNMPHSRTTTLSYGMMEQTFVLCCELFTISTFTYSSITMCGAFTPQRSRRTRDAPFVAVQQVLPPLASITSSRTRASRPPLPLHYASPGGPTNGTVSMLISPYPEFSMLFDGDEDHEVGGDPLPVLYTNDPKLLNKWLVEHVPMEPCAIGFDTESVPDVPWMPNNQFKGRPVTIQVATADASIVTPLLRNHRYSKACLPLL